MKALRSLFPLLLILLTLPVPITASAASRPQEVRGAVMSAETNKPVAGAAIAFFSRGDKGLADTASARSVADGEGRFRVTLPPGAYAWFASADGFGTLQNGTSVKDKSVELNTVYLRKPARLYGRIVDGAGAPVAGVAISADRFNRVVSGADGRFSFDGLDPHGYEPALARPGWVLEKSEYYYLVPGEKKDAGDLVLRRAAALRAGIAVRENGKPRKLDNIRINLSGSSVYRSLKADKRGLALFSDLPPGRYSVSVVDERLKEARQELEIGEGGNSELTLEAELKPPTLSIEEYSEVFLPDRPVTLRANSLRVEKGEALLFRVPAASLLDGSMDLRRPESIRPGTLTVVARFPVGFKARRDSHSRFGRIPLPGLPPGGYLLELKGGGATAGFGFLVTRLGLVAKSSPRGTLLFATDLLSGAPLAGVEVGSLPGSGSAVSDREGLALWKGADTATRLTGRSGDSLAFLELPGRNSGENSAAIKGYVYTDRPAYRPGQTVFFKGVLRQREGEGYRLPAPDKLQVAVKDDNDKSVCESETLLSASGSFNGECVLPAVPALGDYVISVVGNGQSWQGSFKVLEYRKPEFEVKVSADRKFLVAGDSGRISVSARYYFGAPVAGGKLVWRVYSRPAWNLAGDEDSDGHDQEDEFGGGYADFIGEGEVRLDGDGEAQIPLTARNHDLPYSYTLEADVSDASSRQVSASGSVTVVPSLVSLKVGSGNYLVRPGEPQQINIRAASWEGLPRSLPVRLSFGRQVYDKKSRTHSWREADSSTLRTAADGRARSVFTFPEPGYWQVRAEAADEAGRKSVATASVWVWKEGFTWEGSYRQLEAEFDRKSYKPGETARLILRAPATGGSLLLTMEGRDISERRVVPLKGLVEVVEIPVSEALAPYIHVSALTVAGGRFHSRTLPLRVDHQPDRLDLRIATDRPVYGPGDQVRLTVSSASSGKPLPAELSLAVVDEAIFAVTRERSDDIWQFFRGSREHLVTTLHSFPRVYLGGAAKESAFAAAADDGLKGLKIRKVFKDTAAWFPMLETKADGVATAEFTLPDNLTSWRATAVGHTPAGQFGSGREKFIARLELMARLAPPRFLTVGDELQLPGVITSMTDRQQAVHGRFEAGGLTLLGDPTFSGSIAGRGELRTEVGLRADAPGRATLILSARGSDRGDAMELALPVLARSIAREVAGGIALRDRESDAELLLPPEALAGTALLKLDFAPTIAASLNSAIDRLVEFPYGCVEQTLSRFIPAVHARSLLDRSGWQPDPAVAAKLPLVIAEGIRRLEEMQHDDGGWGWWKNDSSSLTMTAHAVYGLGLAKQAGLAVPDNLLKRGLAALEKQMPGALTDDLPRASRALAVNGMRSEAQEKRIVASWKSLPLSERLAYGEALAFGDREQEFEPLIEQFKKELQDEGQASYLKGAEAESWWYGWRWGSSAVESSAAMLSLLVRHDPADPLAARLAAFLARRRQGGWWRTTTATAAAVTALADYVAASGETSASYNARASLNGSELAGWRVEKGRLVSGAASISVPADKLKQGVNRLVLSKDAPGAAYLAAALEYRAAPEAAGSSAGLKLERAMYRIGATKIGNSWRREYTPLKPGESLRSGDDVEVRLTVENQRQLEYVIIEDRLPAGFESRETDRDPRFLDEASYQGWYSDRERRDEKLAFFITSLPAGRHEFRHVIHPELEGRMLALPAAAWPMYQPELRGESSAWKMEVKGR